MLAGYFSDKNVRAMEVGSTNFTLFNLRCPSTRKGGPHKIVLQVVE